MSSFCKCKSYSHFFSKNISIYAIFNEQSFNNTLTNDTISFEQLGPGGWVVSTPDFEEEFSSWLYSASLLKSFIIIIASSQYDLNNIERDVKKTARPSSSSKLNLPINKSSAFYLELLHLVHLASHWVQVVSCHPWFPKTKVKYDGLWGQGVPDVAAHATRCHILGFPQKFVKKIIMSFTFAYPSSFCCSSMEQVCRICTWKDFIGC